jgi:CheY-like chemotaxis protein
VAVRVLLVDDHEVVRRGLRDMLDNERDIQVVAEAGTVAEALVQAEATNRTWPLWTSAYPTATAWHCAANYTARDAWY